MSNGSASTYRGDQAEVPIEEGDWIAFLVGPPEDWDYGQLLQVGPENILVRWYGSLATTEVDPSVVARAEAHTTERGAREALWLARRLLEEAS